ncbi:hypothetical protein NZK33_18645 [Cyanobium sp. FGCU-6]|nr:hypothetical protein [Cyanobium sp. FGCU6]
MEKKESEQNESLTISNWRSLSKKLFSQEAVSLLSLLVAFLAFIGSIRSCQISQEALIQTNKQYREERLLVLQAKFLEKGNGITVSPTDESITFLEGTAYLPSSIHKEEIPIRTNGEFLYMGSVSSDLKKFLAKKISQEKGYAKVSLGGKIPLFIVSYYTVKGHSYMDKSLYFLSMDVVVFDEEYEQPSVNFTGLIFAERFSPNTVIPKKMLDDLINSKDGYYIPFKQP